LYLTQGDIAGLLPEVSRMNMQQTYRDGFGARIAGMRLDGLDGQEDELEDVAKGKLEPHGEVTIRPNHDATSQEKADEDEEEIQADLETRTPG
jgi:hypothetical protein